MEATYHDLIIHTNITASSWSSAVSWSSTCISSWSGGSVVEIIGHLRVQLLSSLLGGTSATWSLSTTRLATLATGRVGLWCSGSGLWLGLWLGDALTKTLWWWDGCCLGGVDNNLNLFQF